MCIPGNVRVHFVCLETKRLCRLCVCSGIVEYVYGFWGEDGIKIMCPWWF